MKELPKNITIEEASKIMWYIKNNTTRYNKVSIADIINWCDSNGMKNKSALQLLRIYDATIKEIKE